MNKPVETLVSIIIPVYNGDKTVCRAVNSILCQTHSLFEIIVVNDASTDNTKAVLDSLVDPRIKVIHLDNNVGRSGARNLAISRAKGEYIAMLDADDFSYPDRLREQLAFMNKHNLSLCGSWAYLVDAAGNRTEWKQPVTANEIRKTILRSNTFIHSSIIARKEAIRECGGFIKSAEPAEDYDLYLKISGKYPVGNVPKILCEYTAPSGIKYSIIEQWQKVIVKWKAIFEYGYSKKNLLYLLSPFIVTFIPRQHKIRLKPLYRPPQK